MRALRALVIGVLLSLAAGASTADAAVVAAGEGASCAAAPSGGAAVCWGYRNRGNLGDGSPLNASTKDTFDPMVPVGLGAAVTAVSMTGQGGGAANHSCAIVSGAAKCWGTNGNGEVGDGTTELRNVPTQVVGLESGVTQIDTHASRSCAIQNGTAKCWGAISKQFSGEPTNADLLVPHDVAGGAGAIAVAPGWRHECIVIADGSVRCYGDNTNDQLGGGAPALGGPVSKLVAGADHNCALVGDALRCWGNGTQLGVGSTDDSATPVTPVGMGSGVTDFDVNWDHVCAIKGGAVFCWGDAGNGRLGDGRPLSASMPAQLTPVAVSGLSNVTAIAVGRSHTCAIVGTAERWCWGSNDHGQLGNEAAGSQSSVPVPVIGSSPVAPTVPPTPNPPAAPAIPVKPPVVRRATPTITFSSKTRRLSRTRTATIATLSCPKTATKACDVRVAKTVKVTIKRKTYTLKVSAPKSVRPGRTASITVKLTRAAAKRLKGRTATVKLTVALGTTHKSGAQKIRAS